MDKSESMADALQSSEEAPQTGGMDAIRDAIKANLEPQQPEPATEKEELPEPPTQEETQPDLEQEREEPEESKEDVGWQKRVDKLHWQKKQLQEELEETRRKLHETQKQATEQTSDASKGIADLVAQADSLDRLEELEEEALNAERWAKRSLTRYRRDPDAVEKEIERRIGEVPDDVEAWLEDLSLNAEFSRESDIPKQRKALQKRQQSFEFAATKYPWLRDPHNPARAWVDQVKQENPGIKNLPEVDLYLARALVGFYLEQEQANKAKQPVKKSPDPTPQPGRPAATRSEGSDSYQQVKAAKANAMKTGSRDGLKEWIKAAANTR